MVRRKSIVPAIVIFAANVAASFCQYAAFRNIVTGNARVKATHKLNLINRARLPDKTQLRRGGVPRGEKSLTK